MMKNVVKDIQNNGNKKTSWHDLHGWCTFIAALQVTAADLFSSALIIYYCVIVRVHTNGGRMAR